MNSRSDERKLIYLIPSSVFFFVIVPGFSVIGGRILDDLLDLPRFPASSHNEIVGVFTLMLGAFVVYESIRVLLKEGRGVPLGDLIESKQSTALITSGIYNRTRNPMLLGYLINIFGLGTILRSISVEFIIPVFYLALWTIWIKKREEPALKKRFGERYSKYKKETPFLLPRVMKA